MAQDVHINVIVPTRERADTLLHCMRTLVSQDYRNLGIIVSDNASKDNTKAVVDSFDDARIRYVNPGKRLGMSRHWEFALAHAEKGWVLFLGDDDGLVPNAIAEIARLVAKHNVEAISSARLFFEWPGESGWSANGKLNVSLRGREEIKNSQTAVRRVLNGRMPYYELPGLYSGGVASIALINRLRDGSGHFFKSLSPDLYASMALSLGTERFLRVDRPLVVTGVSKHSTGVSYRIGNTERTAAAAAQFLSEDNIQFHPSLVLGKSYEIMLYECYLQSWHIHRGAMHVEMKQQLNNAIERAPADLLPTIREECAKIAVVNGFEFRFTGSRVLSAIRRAPYFLVHSFFMQYLNPRELGIQNVYDAAVFAGGLVRVFARMRVSLPLVLLSNFVSLCLRETKARAKALLNSKSLTGRS